MCNDDDQVAADRYSYIHIYNFFFIRICMVYLLLVILKIVLKLLSHWMQLFFIRKRWLEICKLSFKTSTLHIISLWFDLCNWIVILFLQSMLFTAYFLLCSFVAVFFADFCTFSSSCSLTVSLSSSRFSLCVFCGNAFKMACTYDIILEIDEMCVMMNCYVNIFVYNNLFCANLDLFIDEIEQHPFYFIFCTVWASCNQHWIHTSSATAISTNSNCWRVATKPARWSRKCSKVAAISISRAPLFIRPKTKSSRM